ncbi:TPA: acyltransferase family protein, partial [Streptococcus suis]
MNRYLYIDKLKTLGLLLIFLAHVSPPMFLFQLRNFDVILMIIVSCILFFLSRKKLSFGDYILKRFKRLVIPTWIFLTIFFILSFLMGVYFNLKVIISSFALHGGIGYVWVIKIYLLVAIILPLVKPLLLKKEKILYIISLLSLILNEFFAFTGYFDNFAYKYIIGYIIPCLFIIIYSYWLTVSSTKKILLASLFFFIIYTVAAIFLFQKNGSYIDTNS